MEVLGFADTLAAGATRIDEFTYTSPKEQPGPGPELGDRDRLGRGLLGRAVDSSANCSTDLLFPEIDLVKDGPELVHRGDTITYTFEVTNTGEVELFDVELTDPICDEGTIEPGEDVDSSLAVGEVWHFTCLHLVTETTRTRCRTPRRCVATRRRARVATRSRTPMTTWWTSSHPAIDIVKTVDEEVVPVGTTVTFTYVVTNTGDTTLYEISVDDDILGHIGDIAVLEPGDSVDADEGLRGR